MTAILLIVFLSVVCNGGLYLMLAEPWRKPRTPQVVAPASVITFDWRGMV